MTVREQQVAHLAKEGAHKGPAHSMHPCINLRLQAGGHTKPDDFTKLVYCRNFLQKRKTSCCKTLCHVFMYSTLLLLQKKTLAFFVCNCSSDFQIGLSPGLKQRPHGSENGAGQGCGFCLSRYCGPWFHHFLLLASVPANVQLGIRQPLGLFQF